MPFTDHCDLYGAIHETGINIIVKSMMSQRPSLFNYGTAMFVANRHLLCKPVEAIPEVTKRKNPLITEQPLLPIIGADGGIGLEYCFQITAFAIDFHSGNQFTLPPELAPPLSAQHLGIHLQICCGIACPDRRLQDIFAEIEGKGSVEAFELREPLRRDRSGAVMRSNTALYSKDRIEAIIPGEAGRALFVPLVGTPQCFCLDVYAKAKVETAGSGANRYLSLKLEGLEIVDLQPPGLEGSIECYLTSVLRIGLLPRIRIALDTMIFEIASFGVFTVMPTPTSGMVPFNPAIEQDQIKAFINIGT